MTPSKFVDEFNPDARIFSKIRQSRMPHFLGIALGAAGIASSLFGGSKQRKGIEAGQRISAEAAQKALEALRENFPQQVEALSVARQRSLDAVKSYQAAALKYQQTGSAEALAEMQRVEGLMTQSANESATMASELFAGDFGRAAESAGVGYDQAIQSVTGGAQQAQEAITGMAQQAYGAGVPVAAAGREAVGQLSRGEITPLDQSPIFQERLRLGQRGLSEALAAQGLGGSRAAIEGQQELLQRLTADEVGRQTGIQQNLAQLGQQAAGQYGSQVIPAMAGVIERGGQAAAGFQAGRGGALANIFGQRGIGMAGIEQQRGAQQIGAQQYGATQRAGIQERGGLASADRAQREGQLEVGIEQGFGSNIANLYGQQGRGIANIYTGQGSAQAGLAGQLGQAQGSLYAGLGQGLMGAAGQIQYGNTLRDIYGTQGGGNINRAGSAYPVKPKAGAGGPSIFF